MIVALQNDRQINILPKRYTRLVLDTEQRYIFKCERSVIAIYYIYGNLVLDSRRTSLLSSLFIASRGT